MTQCFAAPHDSMQRSPAARRNYLHFTQFDQQFVECPAAPGKYKGRMGLRSREAQLFRSAHWEEV